MLVSVIFVVRRARAFTHIRDALTLRLQHLGARNENIVADYALHEIEVQPEMPSLAVRSQIRTPF